MMPLLWEMIRCADGGGSDALAAPDFGFHLFVTELHDLEEGLGDEGRSRAVEFDDPLGEAGDGAAGEDVGDGQPGGVEPLSRQGDHRVACTESPPREMKSSVTLRGGTARTSPKISASACSTGVRGATASASSSVVSAPAAITLRSYLPLEVSGKASRMPTDRGTMCGGSASATASRSPASSTVAASVRTTAARRSRPSDQATAAPTWASPSSAASTSPSSTR